MFISVGEVFRSAEHLFQLDDDHTALQSPVHFDLGTIEVQMRKVDYYTEGDEYYQGENAREIGPIHERSKKAGAHAVS